MSVEVSLCLLFDALADEKENHGPVDGTDSTA